MAHDFNNLLSVIQGYAELLRDEFTDGEPGAELVDEIATATRRADSLVQRLLVMAEREAMATPARDPASPGES